MEETGHPDGGWEVTRVVGRSVTGNKGLKWCFKYVSPKKRHRLRQVEAIWHVLCLSLSSCQQVLFTLSLLLYYRKLKTSAPTQSQREAISRREWSPAEHP